MIFPTGSGVTLIVRIFVLRGKFPFTRNALLDISSTLSMERKQKEEERKKKEAEEAAMSGAVLDESIDAEELPPALTDGVGE